MGENGRASLTLRKKELGKEEHVWKVGLLLGFVVKFEEQKWGD